MAIKKSTKAAGEEKKADNKIEVAACDVRVDRAKDFEDSISFDMTIFKCIKVYGCTYRTYTDKESGEEKGIVSFPSKKGKDGKYYNHVYFFVNAEVLAKIEKEIEALI